MTTHRERVEACIRGEIIDRPPVALWRHFPVDDQAAPALCEAQIDFQRRYDFDLVKITPASSYSVRDWGVEDEWQGNTEGTRTYTKRVIFRASDWERLQVLEPSSNHLARQLECIRIIRGKIGADTPVIQTIFNPLSQAKHLAGDATLLAHLRDHPGVVRSALEVITETTRRFIEALAGLGLDGIFYAVQHAQESHMPEAEFVHWSRESDLLLLQAAESMWCNMLHVHGERIHFRSFRDYPAQIINWHDREAGPSLSTAASIWPRAVCGGLSRTTLVFGTADELAREAADAFVACPSHNLVLSTGCVVPVIAPHGNLTAARRAPELFRNRDLQGPASR